MILLAQNTTPTWALLTVAGITATASIGAAVVAAVFARRARATEAEAARLRSLEERLASAKADVYRPMIDMLRRSTQPLPQEKRPNSKEILTKTAEFANWVSIYGSDEAVRAFHRLMQAFYTSAPGLVSVRLHSEFVLAARRDLGYPDTDLSALDVLGLRVNDVYKAQSSYDIGALSFLDLCRKYDWEPPWLRDREDMPLEPPEDDNAEQNEPED